MPAITDLLSFGSGDAAGTNDDPTLLDASTVNNMALGWYKTATAADLASQQIKAGQPVTVIGTNGQLAGSANVSAANTAAGSLSKLFSGTGGVLLIVVVLAVLVMGRK